MEHIYIYGSMPFVLFKLYSIKHKSNHYIVLLFILNLFILKVVFIVSIFKENWISIYAFFAGIENFCQPIALILIVYLTTIRLDKLSLNKLIIFSAEIIVLLLGLNTIFSILSIFYDTSIFTGYFTAAGLVGFDETVSSSASKMGRYSGIFNQPAECGLAYSIGLLVWAYIVIIKKRVALYDLIKLALLVIGGSLSISKSFIFGGFPLFIFYLFWSAEKLSVRKITFGCSVFLLIIIAYKNLVAENWIGLDFFLRVFIFESYSEEGIINLLTGNRFGGEEGSPIWNNFIYNLNVAPLFGFGVRDEIAFDNGYLEFFGSAGLVGLALHFFILAIILRVSLIGLRVRHELGKLLFSLWILIVGASLGAPTLTLNRTSIFLWIFLVLIITDLTKKYVTVFVIDPHPAVSS